MTNGEDPALRVLWRSKVGAKAARSHAASERGHAGFEFEVETDPDEALAFRDWADILVDGNPDPALLDGARLRQVIVPYAGVTAKLREATQERPHLTLMNSHFNAPFVAQHALALLLACSNRIAEADRAMRRGDWGPRTDEDFASIQLSGKTALLLGYGAIGKEIEKRVVGLGMEVAVCRRNPSAAVSGPKQFGPDRLHEALAIADVVLVSLPATPETTALLDHDAIDAMRNGAILVNVGRGDVVDAEALYHALKNGRLHGAGLDVWWRYPKDDEARRNTFPAEPPLHELPNVVMSPHRANQVENWEQASFEDVLRTIQCLRAGEFRNRVDTSKGY